jgi:hypothetical protein
LEKSERERERGNFCDKKEESEEKRAKVILINVTKLQNTEYKSWHCHQS